jgi:hypothetical protein
VSWHLAYELTEALAAIFGIGTGTAVAVRGVRTALSARAGVTRAPSDVDFTPFWFQLDLMTAIPRVTVHVYVTNYTRWKVELTEASIRTLTILQTYLSKIDLADSYTMLPHSTRHVTLSRDPTDAEFKLLLPRAIAAAPCGDAAASIVGKWKAWREHRYAMVGDSSLHGHIVRPAPPPNDTPHTGRRVIHPGIKVV